MRQVQGRVSVGLERPGNHRASAGLGTVQAGQWRRAAASGGKQWALAGRPASATAPLRVPGTNSSPGAGLGALLLKDSGATPKYAHRSTPSAAHHAPAHSTLENATSARPCRCRRSERGIVLLRGSEKSSCRLAGSQEALDRPADCPRARRSADWASPARCAGAPADAASNIAPAVRLLAQSARLTLQQTLPFMQAWSHQDARYERRAARAAPPVRRAGISRRQRAAAIAARRCSCAPQGLADERAVRPVGAPVLALALGGAVWGQHGRSVVRSVGAGSQSGTTIILPPGTTTRHDSHHAATHRHQAATPPSTHSRRRCTCGGRP